MPLPGEEIPIARSMKTRPTSGAQAEMRDQERRNHHCYIDPVGTPGWSREGFPGKRERYSIFGQKADFPAGEGG